LIEQIHRLIATADAVFTA